MKSFESGNTIMVGLDSAEGVPVGYKILDATSNDVIASGSFVVV